MRYSRIAFVSLHGQCFGARLFHCRSGRFQERIDHPGDRFAHVAAPASRGGVQRDGIGVVDPEGPVVDVLEERKGHRIIGPSQVVLFRERSVLVTDGDREQPAAGPLPARPPDVGRWLR